MCIICNCGLEVGDEALVAHGRASFEMKRAAAAMQRCAKHAKEPEQRRQYDRTHKAMVRLIRDWNRLEHSREVITPRMTNTQPVAPMEDTTNG